MKHIASTTRVARAQQESDILRQKAIAVYCLIAVQGLGLPDWFGVCQSQN